MDGGGRDDSRETGRSDDDPDSTHHGTNQPDDTIDSTRQETHQSDDTTRSTRPDGGADPAERVTPADVTFETGGRSLPTVSSAILLLGWGLIGALFAVDVLIVAPDAPIDVTVKTPGELLPGWDPTRMDWVTMLTTVLALAAATPYLRNTDRLRAAVAAYPNGTLPRLALVVCLTTVVVGVVGPILVPEPTVDLQGTDQPPVGFGVAQSVAGTCVGPIVDEMCRGSLQHPLGTTPGGADVLSWIVYGTRTVVQFALVSAAIMAPLGVVAGVSAGYLGGRFDAFVTGYADLQQTVPTVIIYFLVTAVSKPDLFMLVLVYGLFNWGGIARLVRSRTLEERESAYVEAAESAGASKYQVLRRHLLPNVGDTAVTAVSLELPKLVLVEVALSFLSLGGEGTLSWGQLLQRGLRFQLGGARPPYTLTGNVRTLWWVPLVPAVATAVIVAATSVVGDAAQRAADPDDAGD